MRGRLKNDATRTHLPASKGKGKNAPPVLRDPELMRKDYERLLGLAKNSIAQVRKNLENNALYLKN